MKAFKFKRVVLFVFWMLILILPVQSQITLIPENSSVKINGTSSLHDWEETVEQFNVDFSLRYKENVIIGIDHVYFKCKSSSVMSDNSLMTSKTHDALKTDKYAEITFKLISADKFIFQNGKISGTLTGDVFLGGITKRISVAFAGNIAAGKINIKGSQTLNMNDFNIKPPTAMLGTLKTGEEVTIGFDLQFKVSQPIAASNNY
jgi:hypothetical protein